MAVSAAMASGQAGETEGSKPRQSRIRVAVADDNYLAREALLHVLAQDERIEIVARCSDRDSLLRAVDEAQPDAVVTDIRMPPSETDEGVQVAARLRTTHPEIGVVLLSQFAEPRYAIALLDGGSERRAYVLKERIQHRDQLIAAIEAVTGGASMIDAKVVELLIDARTRAKRSGLADLTPRETEILALVARGHSNQAIADELVLTKRAVEKHINAIFLKLRLTEAEDVSRRVKAALIYLAESDAG